MNQKSHIPLHAVETWEIVDLGEAEGGLGKKGSDSSQLPCISTSHQSQVTRPISFGMQWPDELNDITDAFHDVFCRLLHHMLPPSYLAHEKSTSLENIPSGSVTYQVTTADQHWKEMPAHPKWKFALCWPVWQLLVVGVEAKIRGHQALVDPS